MHDYVTERELQANLRPLKEDIWEIRGDVKTLLLSQAKSQAVVEERASIAHQTKDRGARRLALVATAAAVISGAWWVPDALAKAFS